MKQVSLDEIRARVGAQAATGAWLTIEQSRIDQFAAATDDHQFIHVDPERAAATPFGGTIAHGFLTLSLIPHLVDAIAEIPEGTVMGINYGLDKLRFLQPVAVGSEVRAHSRILAVERRGDHRILIRSEVTVEIRGLDKPALVAETLAMFVLAPTTQGAAR